MNPVDDAWVRRLVREAVREELRALAHRVEMIRCTQCMNHHDHKQCDDNSIGALAKAIRGEQA